MITFMMATVIIAVGVCFVRLRLRFLTIGAVMLLLRFTTPTEPQTFQPWFNSV